MDHDSYQRRLEYHPSLETSVIAQTVLAPDRVNEQTGRAVAGFRTVRGTLASRVEGGKVVDRYCHANITLVVRDGFQDVSPRFKVRRLRRHWSADLNQHTGAVSGGVTPDPGPGARVLYGFESDFGTGSWIDAPGKTPGLDRVIVKRHIEEFVVGVGEFNGPDLAAGFAGKYFVVIVEFIPRGYKIWMSLAKPLSEDQLRAALGVSTQARYPSEIIRPGGPPDLASFRWVAHETWQPFA